MAITVEIYQGRKTACLNCNLQIKKGDSHVACRSGKKKRGKANARFCSPTCEERYSWVVIERRVQMYEKENGLP